MIRPTLIVVFLLACLDATAALAQANGPAEAGRYMAQPAPPAPPAQPAPPAPAIRRWLDVQSVHAASRFRWYKNSAGRLNSSSLQWQSQLRGRFLFDQAGRYSIGTLASTGSTLPSSWNNTGGGLGQYSGAFNVKQLFLSAEPVKGLELQAGGLFMNRGEMAEHLTYDSDAYIVGERVTVRPSKGRVTQIAVTAGHFGDFREVNVFKRLDRMTDLNYGQALVGFRLGPRAAASVDYTHEDGRDIIRQGINLRMPATVKLLTALKFEAYQRVSDDDGQGFHAAADARWKRLSVTGGVMSVDRNYTVGTIPFNGDRYETGHRWYSIGGVTLTRDLSVGWFQSEAFNVDFPIPLKHRFDLFITFNPTASLKRAGIF
ncbi:MAG: hypothetical protein Q8T13_14845 [Acidobacteriota bacterium]|nr:hypothetical protein [Acidobacteriota bacterium]